jgi:DNA-binding transcriptional LysR family regulator
VAAGLGIAVIPAILPVRTSGVVVVALRSPRVSWTMTAVTAAHERASGAVQALRAMIADTLPSD